VTNLFRNKRAITPVLSSLLLTVITVAAMSLVATAAYVISDNLHQTMGERFIAEDVWFRTGSIDIYLRNVGKVDLTISSVYVNFTLQSTSPLTLQVDKHGWLNITYTWTSGQVYHINIVTTRGAKVADYYVAP
jgi:flagellin-like protein